MSALDDGGQAFPGPVGASSSAARVPGMSLRDYFAAQVVSGFRFTTPLDMPGYSEAERKRAVELGARFAYELADAMLLVRGGE